MRTRFFIWVTSNCNLRCPFCSQSYTMRENAGYEMSIEEIDHIVDSCKSRGIRFGIIELTGGEASLWTHLEYGEKRFEEISDIVTMVTNGNDPERVKALGMSRWIVSASQATKEQLSHYENIPNVVFNSHKHKKMPVAPIPNSLPAVCCLRVSPEGEPQNAIEYIRGKVYYCCDAFAHTEHTGLTDDIVCDFEDDFLAKFADKKFDKAICSYCLCNGKVWEKI